MGKSVLGRLTVFLRSTVKALMGLFHGSLRRMREVWCPISSTAAGVYGAARGRAADSPKLYAVSHDGLGQAVYRERAGEVGFEGVAAGGVSAATAA